MNATSLYVSTCRLVLQANPEDPGCWTDLYRLIPYLRQSLSCTVCGNLLIEPYTPTETNCQHHVCRSCKGGKKKLKPSCSWCKNYEKMMCKTTASGDANIANMTELISEGAGFKDEYKSNSGLSKSAYSILPCIYASASTQTITQAVSLKNESDITVDEDVAVSKSNLSNGSSIYSVTYAGSGNKMVIKRKAMLNKGEVENCENLRLLKGTNFKRPIHRRGNFRGRGRSFKEEEKTISSGVNNGSVSSNNINSGRVNVKKKKLGCRCGNATASPGKLTCCGQRCPCYVDSKACLDCKCRGCRNPHTKEGQKVIRDPLDSANSKIQSSAQLQTDECIPTRGTGSLRTESRRSFRQEKRLSQIEETDDSYSLLQQREIQISVESIENIDPNKVREIMVKVEYRENIIGQSFLIPITTEKVDIGLSGCLIAEEVTPQFLDEILSNPILFTVFDCTSCASTAASTTSPNPEKDPKKKPSKVSDSPASNSFLNCSTVLGICNLDIGDLAMGKTRIKDTLLIEPDKKVSPTDIITWVKLPRLVVTVTTRSEPLLPDSENKFNNVIGVTVESVYNVPDYIAEGSVFDATIPVPSLGDKGNSVKFPGGATVCLKDSCCRKKWLNLTHIEGRGARSKKSISPTACDVTNTLPEDLELENEMNKSLKMIQWNTWKNSFMLKKDVNNFCMKIMKYRVWPIDISVPSKSKEMLTKDKSAKSDKKSKPLPSVTQPSGTDHFTAFLDLSPLLYPGVNKVRVAAQLYSYSQTDLVNKCGSEFPVSYSQASMTNGKVKTNSERSKASIIREPEDNKETPGQPITNDDGNPTFIIVQIELYKALTPKKNPELIESSLRDRVSLKGKIKKKTTNLNIVYDKFSKSITDMVSILSEEHNNFSVSFQNNIDNSNDDFDSAFYKFLCKRENFHKIKATLERKIVDLISEKYGTIREYEETIPEIYVYLVNEMHKITNRCIIGQDDISSSYFNTNDLQLYAMESIEEGEYESARDYLLLKLSRETSNPDYWLDCAVCCVSLNKYEAAVEAVREALNLNFHHQIGLLMYALLMARFHNASVAQEAFDVLLTKYPNFMEGWVALRLFYSVINNNEGVLVANQMITKLRCEGNLTKDTPVEEEDDQTNFYCRTYPDTFRGNAATEGKYGVASFRNGISSEEPLSWTTLFCPPDNANTRALILLSKLGFYEYVSLSLSQALLSTGANEDNLPAFYTYYTSVNLYQQGQYEEAICNLQKFVKIHGKDCFVWSLLGHCYYKLQNHEKATACYEYVMESYNRPNDIHLIYLRMGLYYNQAKKYSCAKQVFTAACKYSPTPKLWKGLGVACLKMDELDEAEIAFGEANYLDNRDPETWAYLALTNGLMRKLELLKYCYLEAKKRNLQNEELEEEIKFYVSLHGLREEEFEV